MFEKLNEFLQKNRAIIITTVFLNAFFLLVVIFFLNMLYGVQLIGLAPADEVVPESRQDEFVPQSDQEALVVNAVAEANPAVVSIVATADLPEISEEERRFFEFFAPFFELPEGESGEREVGGGSGFFVSSDGLIVTNRHVVDDESLEYTVVTKDGDRYSATVVAKDPTYDVAILDVDIESAPYLEFADSDEIVLGQSVIAIGNALAEFSNSITKGVISGLSRSIVAGSRAGQTELLENVIQTDAGINPGNSGGPLLNLAGEVIGVNVAVAQGSENIGFALPSNLVAQIVESVEETGEIVRPYIGVRYVILNEQIAASEDLSVSEGVIIVSGGLGAPAVVPESPADEAGLREGDIITEFNGEAINNSNSFARLIREAGVGANVELTVLRNGEEMTVNVTLEEAPNDLE